MLLHRLGVWEWMGYAAWAAVHAYIFTSWFNQYEDIYFPHSGHQSHAQKAPHTQQHRGNLSVNVVSSLTGARTIIHLVEKELTLCCNTLTTNCCCAPPPVYRLFESLEKLQLIMPAVVATYA